MTPRRSGARAGSRASHKHLEAPPTAAEPRLGAGAGTPSAKEAQDDRQYPYRASVAIASSIHRAAHQDRCRRPRRRCRHGGTSCTSIRRIVTPRTTSVGRPATSSPRRDHLRGAGSPLVRAAVAAGSRSSGRVLSGSRALERRLKRWHKTTQFCPICRRRRDAGHVDPEPRARCESSGTRDVDDADRRPRRPSSGPQPHTGVRRDDVAGARHADTPQGADPDVRDARTRRHRADHASHRAEGRTSADPLPGRGPVDSRRPSPKRHHSADGRAFVADTTSQRSAPWTPLHGTTPRAALRRRTTPRTSRATVQPHRLAALRRRGR